MPTNNGPINCLFKQTNSNVTHSQAMTPVAQPAAGMTAGKAASVPMPASAEYYPSGPVVAAINGGPSASAVYPPAAPQAQPHQVLVSPPDQIQAANGLGPAGLNSAGLGPQRVAMYAQPSTVQGYHPYRRS